MLHGIVVTYSYREIENFHNSLHLMDMAFKSWPLQWQFSSLMQISEEYNVCKFDSNLAGLQRFKRIFVKAILCKCQKEFF